MNQILRCYDASKSCIGEDPYGLYAPLLFIASSFFVRVHFLLLIVNPIEMSSLYASCLRNKIEKSKSLRKKRRKSQTNWNAKRQQINAMQVNTSYSLKVVVRRFSRLGGRKETRLCGV